jgi:hypothetical protein
MSKVDAWNSLGLKFWTHGRRTAKPTLGSVRWFVDGLDRSGRCLVVGGTSVGLIRAALASGTRLTVLDFSARICNEVMAVCGDEPEVVLGDILDPPEVLLNTFSHVLCDRLINRFDWDEAVHFSDMALGVLRPGGILRTTIHLGLYASDLELLRTARETAISTQFWDPASGTIDYALAEPLLGRSTVRHGGISVADLRAWYRQRGREKRYSRAELTSLFADARWSSVELRDDLVPSRLVVVRSEVA